MYWGFCPSCGCGDLVTILYGIPEAQSNHICNRCGQRWYEPLPGVDCYVFFLDLSESCLGLQGTRSPDVKSRVRFVGRST
jgi:transcription elongation factor Elf1